MIVEVRVEISLRVCIGQEEKGNPKQELCRNATLKGKVKGKRNQKRAGKTENSVPGVKQESFKEEEIEKSIKKIRLRELKRDH